MTETILKCENLTKVFGKQEVLKGINLDIRSGEIFGIIGSSGAGKSTLLNTIIGFIGPTTGSMLFQSPHLLNYEGADKDQNFRSVLEHSTEVKKLIGFAAQRPSVYGKLTLMENLDLFGSLYNLSYDARVTNSKILLKLMGLYDSRNTLAERLSGGMMKRLDIACALIHDPKILILDEPTADLDPYLRKQMWYLIRKINSKGTTIILSSHFLDELEELCDRIGIIHNGRMENYGTPAELKRLYKTGEEVHVSTVQGKYKELEEKLSKNKSKLKISDMTNMGHELIIKTHNPVAVVKDLVSASKSIKDEILDLRVNRPSLNQVFEDIIQKDVDAEAAHEKAEAAEAKKESQKESKKESQKESQKESPKESKVDENVVPSNSQKSNNSDDEKSQTKNEKHLETHHKKAKSWFSFWKKKK